MARNFKQTGDVLDWVNLTGAAVTSNSVVKAGATLGVALVDIAPGAVGAVRIQGVFELPKVTTAVIAQGDPVLWDVSAGKFDAKTAAPATGDVSGAAAMAFAAAGNGATTVLIRLTGTPGTVAP
ncbi:DUF2190 family protein [Chitiniphilus purpureus]|uniref:DUF2190 family protein n=1 Tax=Chitiniphilus purpureus TaxID=2981137 RepID=A0ABY6DHR2_9NEIS|nr:DUF2190 family protein [Chitiniphilus sp. CD1]UXY13861.1 DUF2190 family protein [Chitiniphilus sp. CD1]